MSFVLLEMMSVSSDAHAKACNVPAVVDLSRIAGTGKAIDHFQQFDDDMGCRVEAYLFDQADMVKSVKKERTHCSKHGRRYFISWRDTALQNDGSISFSALSRDQATDAKECGSFAFPADYVFFGKGISSEMAVDLLEVAELIRSRIGLMVIESNSMEEVVHTGRLLEVATGTEPYPWSAMFCQDTCVVVNFHLAGNDDVGEFKLIEVLP